ncbi:MAG: DUF2341 domain-containing protein [Candidatus Doudnabacteria bacterium]|nr:DUF2341 domain-containing protein [Candidatus Doudnabacteria bacterium]
MRTSSRASAFAAVFLGAAICFLLSLTSSVQAWYSDTSWLYRKSFVIDHTKVSGGVDLVNFPVLINVTDTDFKHTLEGGKVGKLDGTDILLTASDGTTKLDHEIELYSSSAGQLVLWVRVPVLSVSADTTLYLYYGNAAAADQQNKTGVWNNNYKGVWHLGEGDSTAGDFYTDSTINNEAATLTDTDGDSGLMVGKIGNAFDFSADADYIDAGVISALASSTSASLSAWLYRSSTGDSAGLGMVGKSDMWGRFNLNWQNDGNIYNQAENFSLGSGSSYPNYTANVSGWHHVVMAYDGNQTGLNRLQVYFDGVLQVLSPGNIHPASALPGAHNLSSFRFGADTNDGVDRFWGGAIDEGRILINTLSAGWVATEYNNQSEPAEFYSVGSEQQYDTSAPVISSLIAGSVNTSSAVITWSTNEGASSQVEYGTSSVLTASSSLSSGLVTSHSVSLNFLSPSTTYYFRAVSLDASGNRATTSLLTFGTSAVSSSSGGGGGGGYSSMDSTPPLVSVAAPSSTVVLNGTSTLSATVSDNVGVAGVMFKIDGLSVGDEIGNFPYSISFDTKKFVNGSHIVVAVARDTAGNTSSSLPISFNINNNFGSGNKEAASVPIQSLVAPFDYAGPKAPEQELALPYKSRTLVNDKGTIYVIDGKFKLPFVSMSAFSGLGYKLKYVVKGDVSLYKLPQSYVISTAKAEHPWGSILSYGSKLYYAHETGMIPISSKTILSKNGITVPYSLIMNPFDREILKKSGNIKPLVENDPRISQ